MTNLDRAFGYSVALTLMVGGLSFANDARELEWVDLIPGGDAYYQQLEDAVGSGGQYFEDEDWGDDPLEEGVAMPVYPSGVVEELDGVRAKIPGFIVPLELAGEGEIKEFLLVPYFGACIHYPPPPPNQIVYVKLEKPVELESAWDPIWVTGELKTQFFESDIGSAGYTMAGQKIEEYEY